MYSNNLIGRAQSCHSLDRLPAKPRGRTVHKQRKQYSLRHRDTLLADKLNGKAVNNLSEHGNKGKNAAVITKEWSNVDTLQTYRCTACNDRNQS